MRYLLPLLLLFMLPAEAAEIVKCTTADGDVIYTEAPCPAGTEAETLDITSRPSDPAAIEAQRKQRQLTLQQIEEEREAEAEAESSKAEANALRQRKCAQARRNAEKLLVAKRMTVEEDGKRRYVSEEEMAERRRLNRERLAKYCD